MATTERGKAEWWMWAMGLALVAGLIWLIASMADNDRTVVQEDVVRTEEARTVEDPNSEYLQIEAMTDSPLEYRNRTVTGEVWVEEVVSDRGFFVRGEDKDEKVFAYQDPAQMATPVVVEPGQRIQMTSIVHSISEFDQVAPKNLERDVRSRAMTQPIFLHVTHLAPPIED